MRTVIALAIRLVVNAIALWVAAAMVDGISLSSRFESVLWVAAIFGLVNAVIKPVTKLLTFPLIVLTLGLFTLLINAAMLWLTDLLSDAITVDGFWATVFGAIIITIVSWALSIFVPDGDNG